LKIINYHKTYSFYPLLVFFLAKMNGSVKNDATTSAMEASQELPGDDNATEDEYFEQELLDFLHQVQNIDALLSADGAHGSE
jgi:hypothetical protein